MSNLNELYKTIVDDNPELKQLLEHVPEEQREQMLVSLKELVKEFHNKLLVPLGNIKT